VGTDPEPYLGNLGKTVVGGGGSNKPGRQFGAASCMAVKAQH
jgi:hypothetical protein